MKKIISIFFLFQFFYSNGQTLVSDSIINKYSKVLSVDYCENAISIPAGTANQFNIGEKVLIIQMKGAVLDESTTLFNGTLVNYSSAGNYEINEIRSINSNLNDDIVLEYELEKKFEPNNFVQIISIPEYQNVVFQNELSCKAWDGGIGGVLIYMASGSSTLNANIDVSKKGFRGAQVIDDNVGGCYTFNGFSGFNCENSLECGALKGEGIGNRYETQELGRAINANGGGGGNDHNGGGGGGSAFGKGGNGGIMSNTFCDGLAGFGADIMEYSPLLNKIFLSGAGGAGDINNSTTNSQGGNAGALVFISSSEFNANNNAIISNGETINGDAIDDGGGGGGGGGVVVLEINDYNDNLTIELNGGNGTNVLDGIRCPGPGGGGSGGVLWLSQPNIDPNITLVANGGIAGIVNLAPCAGSNNGATDGALGGVKFNFPNSISNTEFEKMMLVAGDDSTICGEGPIPLWAEVNSSRDFHFQWTWNGGTENDLSFDFNPNNPGKYQVEAKASYTIFDQNCEDISLINVDIRNPNLEIDKSSFFGDTIVIGEAFFLNAIIYPLNTEYVYNWSPEENILSPNEKNTVATPIETGTFCVTVTDELLCEKMECVELYVKEPTIISPDAFTPNGDGINDDFIPIFTRDLNVVAFRIYNRWGSLVYQTSENIAWDGMKDGIEQVSESYIWHLEMQQIISNKTFRVQGNISIIR